MKVLLIVWAGIFAQLILVKSVYAAAPSVTAYPSSVNLDTGFSVTATMSGLTSNAVYRLRIVFAPTGTSNYFGSTWNGSSWYNGTPSPISYSNFYSITTNSSGAWWGDIQGMVESDDPNFTTGGGTYDLKVGRYTQTGSTATWSNIVSTALTVPPTPTPTNTPTPTPGPTSTPTPVANTPVPTKTPTPTPKLTNTPTPSLGPTLTSTPSASISGVLGESSTSADATQIPSPTNSVEVLGTSGDNGPKVLIGLGLTLLSACGILIFRFYRKGQRLFL